MELMYLSCVVLILGTKWKIEQMQNRRMQQLE